MAHQQRRRTFLLSADQIQSLKRRISLQSSRDAATRLSKRASAYVAVSSLAWTCIVRAKSMDHADDAYLMVNADGRRRLRPPLGEGFFGNCVKPCYARANVGDLCGEEGGLACAAAAIQDAIREYVEELEDPFSDVEAFLELYGALPPERVSVMGSSHRFMAYETDFGWGAPSRVELVSLFRTREMVVLLGASDGGVQLSVSLDQPHMEAFQNNFRQVTEEAELRSASSSSPPPGQRRRTYLLSADQVESLKQRIFQRSKIANGQPSKPPSTYVAVSSLAWTCVVRAKSLSHADDAFFMLTADCRRRLRPPVHECFFGNCVTGCYARATVGDLCADADGLARAASAIENAIREQLEEPENPLTDIQRWFELHAALPLDRLAAMGSSHRFKAYETDFGWGSPRRVELVSVFGREMVTLLGARDGGVQVSAALDRACMDAFAANFRRVAGGARQGSSAA